MKKVQIYGTGCPKCQALAANVDAAARELELEIEVDKVTGIRDIAAAGVLITPALAIDGEIKSTGHLLSVHQIKEMLA
ncbi:MAG: TM0996/MTH895 family glutaredoxin-like protein [Gemmatimonadetes bacterium]|nr:TM0996/MTH895 family glutaredoxin-like protein [Gemmatimonadota bacterium]